MYGVIAFNKGNEPHSTEFCTAEGKEPHSTEFCVAAGRRLRGSACKGCRIARVKCSGKLDGSACTRCKRLSVACLYTGNSPSRRSRSSSNTPPRKQCRENLHNSSHNSQINKPQQPPHELLTMPPGPLCSAPSQSENLEGDSGPYEASIPRSSGQCKCLQAMALSLSSLRSWKLTGFPTWSADGATANVGIVENFLTLFEQSTTSLEAVENCPLACMLSEDLSVILLFVVELLADLLVGLLKGDVCEPHPSNANQLPAQTTTDSSPARVGSFDIKDPLDVRMVLNLLLQIRAQSVSAYISRWGDRINEFGFKSIQCDLQRIHQTLSTVTPLNNTRESSGVMVDNDIFGFNSQWLPDLLPESLSYA